MKSRLLSIVLTGIGLALLLLLAVRLVNFFRAQPEQTIVSDGELTQELNKTINPAFFTVISHQKDNVLWIEGTGEPGGTVFLTLKDDIVARSDIGDDGTWKARIQNENNLRLSINMYVDVEEGIRVQSDETAIYIPGMLIPASDDALDSDIVDEQIDQYTPPLIMLSVPAGPSRIFQSPFEGQPSDGGFSMGPVDYDETGGVIFSGMSTESGEIRLSSVENLIGETSVSGGRPWFFIAAETLLRGSYDIEVKLTKRDGGQAAISIPFERLEVNSDLQDLHVYQAPHMWQIQRPLRGGGVQTTAIFSPHGPDADNSDGQDGDGGAAP